MPTTLFQELSEDIQEEIEDQLLSTNNWQDADWETIDKMGKLLPVGLFFLYENGTPIYLNKAAEKMIGYSLYSLKRSKAKLPHHIIFDKTDLKHILIQFGAFIKKRGKNHLLSFFTRIKRRKENDPTWIYISIKKIKSPIVSGSKTLCGICLPIEHFENLTHKIEHVLEEQAYLKTNREKYNQLTKREREVLHFISHGLDTKEIASKLYLSTHTVNQHRKNIKSKIKHTNQHELIRFAKAFDMCL